MDQSILALASGLIGAIVGAAGSVGTIIVQSHFQNKREKRRMAFDAAIEDHKAACEIASKSSANVAPLTAYLHFHVCYYDLLDSGKLSPESLRKLKDERDILFGKSSAVGWVEQRDTHHR
jgi:hypothetical protein